MSPRPDASPFALPVLPASVPRGRWLILALVALFCLQVTAFRWGVITPDTVFQWGQALSGRYDDWHPPATTWLWRQLIPLGPGTAPVLIFYALLYWAGVGLIADTLRQRGRLRSMIAVVVAAALPIPFGQMGAILKDPLLAACCLVSGGLLFAFRDRPGNGRTVAFVAALILLQFGSATRFNAVFATAPLLIAWLPERWLSSLPRIVPLLAGTALLLIAGGWMIDTVALRPHQSQPVYSLVNFDLAGIVANGGANPYPDMSVDEARRWTALCYDPGMYNPTYREDCDEVEIHLRTFAEAHRLSGPVALVRAISASPTAYARHRLSHLNRNWRFWVSHVPDDAIYAMTTPNRFGIGFTANRLTGIVLTGARWMAWSPLGRPATWVGVAMGLLVIGTHLRSRRVIIALAGSALIYGCGYSVFSVAPDMRYNFWTMIAAMMALVIASGEIGAARTLSRQRLLVAALPVSFAVLMESLALLVA